MSARVLTIAIALFAFVAQAQELTVEQYIATLERMRSSIAANELAGARLDAAAIRGAKAGDFHADDSLLHAIIAMRGPDPLLLARIDLTITELRSTATAASPPDAKLLQQVAAEQEVPELASGGEVPTVVVPDTPLAKRIAKSIADAFRWIGKKIEQFIDWLRGFFPKRSASEAAATSGLRWIVIVVVILIVIAIIILALEVTRRSRGSDPNVVASDAPLRSSRDDDPLSRGANEWERYAAQLAADGRFREAIRAWYHAVLVTCYAAGVLHFRKGRTNWEYIASLPPSTAWRAELIRLTQRFEQEWYGSERSTPEVLDDCADHARNVLDALRNASRGAA